MGRRDSSGALTQVAAAGIVASVLFVGTAGIMWRQLVQHEVEPLVAAGHTCRNLNDVPGLRGTPLDHWATGSLVILMQGQAPRALVLSYDGGCAIARKGGPIVLEAALEAAGTGGESDGST